MPVLADDPEPVVPTQESVEQAPPVVKPKEATMPENEPFQFEQIKPGMDRDSSQKAVSAILTALRNENAGSEAVTKPPVLPNGATPAQVAVFNNQSERFVEYLLAKPTSQLTPAERKYILQETVKCIKEGF
jgi:hypothetical protein